MDRKSLKGLGGIEANTVADERWAKSGDSLYKIGVTHRLIKRRYAGESHSDHDARTEGWKNSSTLYSVF